MNCNQPVETLSKKHFAAYNQVIDDYKSLAMFEQEMEVYSDFKESQEYQKAKSQAKKILTRIIENKAFLGWNYEAESIELKTY
jgi:regulator of sigma D